MAIVIPRPIAERVRREAEKLGVSVEEYIADLLLEDLDPRDRAREYVEVAGELLRQAESELERGNIRQAAEKVWGACALAVKAYAYQRDCRRLTSHGELWEYKSIMASELGEWVRVAFQQASCMHTCFYEGWCDEDDVKVALKAVEKLVRAVEGRVARHEQ